MKTLTLLVAGVLTIGALTLAPEAEAREICSDVIDEDCHALVCTATPNGGRFCSRDLNPVCVREPCPQPIP